MPRVTSDQISAQLRDEASLAARAGQLGRVAELRRAAGRGHAMSPTSRPTGPPSAPAGADSSVLRTHTMLP